MFTIKDFSLEFNDAIKNGKWLNIQYDNGEEITKFYAAIMDFSIEEKTLNVKMFNLAKGTKILSSNKWSGELGIKISVEKIVSVSVLQQIIYEPPKSVVNKLETLKLNRNWMNTSIGEKRIFNYYIRCLHYDISPVISKEFNLKKIDKNIFNKTRIFKPENHHYYDILASVTNFDKKMDPKKESNITYAFNLLSIRTPKGIFPILYRDFTINLEKQTLVLGENVKVNRSIQLRDKKYHISNYLEINEKDLVELYLSNFSKLKSIIAKKKKIAKDLIDSSPVLYTFKRTQIVNIDEELRSIRDNNDKHHPVNAFLGKLTNRNKGRKEYPIFLTDDKVNIDQLRVINNSLRMPVTYVQGPPGTGKTTTILNVIMSYFVNEKTVLLSSYNNKPVNDVLTKLNKLKYKTRPIYFPVLRLGNIEMVHNSLIELKEIYHNLKNVKVYESTLNKVKSNQIENLKDFYEILEKYEKVVELRERRDQLTFILEQANKSGNSFLTFNIDIEADISEIDKELKKIGTIPDEKALELLSQDFDEFYKWLYYTSCMYYQKLDNPNFSELKEIIFSEYDEDYELVRKFNNYIYKDTNLRKLLKIFPIIISTNLSVKRLGTTKPHFDLTIIDEAGQCSIPSSLVPISRGEKLLLVGDVQQLKPVISLEEPINKRLKELYSIRDEYDYTTNSILSTMREMDVISLRVLLRFHYRCSEKIIEYSNKTYYNGLLKVQTKASQKDLLVMEDVQSSKFQKDKNTAIEEVKRIEKILRENSDVEYGIITPFRAQSELIKDKIKDKFPNVEIGTIHKFQGGEKDGIIISCGITKATHKKTYDWLKANHSLINVAVTRAKSELRLLGDKKTIKKLSDKNDHFYQLVKYIESNGDAKTIILDNDDTNKKHPDTYFEKQFKSTIDIAIEHFDTLRLKDKVKVASVLKSAKTADFEYFTKSEFDFSIFSGDQIIAVYEIDGKEHENQQQTIERDKKKQEICDKDNIRLFRIKNKDVKNYELIKSKLYKLVGEK